MLRIELFSDHFLGFKGPKNVNISKILPNLMGQLKADKDDKSIEIGNVQWIFNIWWMDENRGS